MSAPTACINVDVDGLHLYYRIHGLAEPDGGDAPTVWESGVRRFLDLFARHRVRATFFAVGEDLALSRNAAIARRLLDEGHELASHSFTHPYDLIRLPDAALEAELSRAEDAIAALRGSRPAGFRAPGYNTSPRLLGRLRARGYAYDSSLFPCPPYLLARAAVIGLYAALGRRSHSLVGSPSAMLGRRLPHRIRRGPAAGLLELPITVLPGTRLPLIGTSLILAGERGWALVRRAVGRLPFVNLELHAIDMTDHAADRIDDALLRQPDQRAPLARKEAIFDACVGFLAERFAVRTLEEVAAGAE